jgi:probable lipoprotein NlpC
MLPAWAESYTDIPFKEKGRDRSGCDCWGLARLIWREQFGLEVPSYAEGYATTKDVEDISAMVTGHPDRQLWQPFDLTQARAGDALLIRMRNRPMHVAVVLDPPWFLHIEEGMEPAVVLERYDSMMWAKRVLGVFRHQHLQRAIHA